MNGIFPSCGTPTRCCCTPWPPCSVAPAGILSSTGRFLRCALTPAPWPVVPPWIVRHLVPLHRQRRALHRIPLTHQSLPSRLTVCRHRMCSPSHHPCPIQLEMPHTHQPAAFGSNQSGSSLSRSACSAPHLSSHLCRAVRSWWIVGQSAHVAPPRQGPPSALGRSWRYAR